MISHFSELKKIPDIIEGENPQELGFIRLKQNKLSDSTTLYDKWHHNLNITVNLLDRIGVNYVLIKNIDIPYAFMKDIDLLIEDKRDLERLKAVLKQMNFIIQKRGVSRSDKVTAIGNYGVDSRVEIDIYVDPTWWTIDYAQHGLITSNRIRKNILGRMTYLPSPTHDLFILATHSYWHGSVTIAEVSQIARLILNEKIKWDHLLSMAKTYHLEHPLFLYFVLVSDIFNLMCHKDAGLQKCMAELKRKHLCRLIVETVRKRNKSFPLQIPYIFKIVSSADEILRSVTRKRLRYREAESYFLCLLFSRRIQNV